MDGNRRFQLVVMGASAGAVETLSQILPALPADFPLPVVTVVHLPARRPSMLPALFANKCAIRAREAEDKERLEPGTAYFAPPGYHVLVERDGTLSLDCDEPVNFSRPSIDVLFESAARAFGRSTVGVLLTGASEDGAQGLAQIKSKGGTTVVQSPDTASVNVMPLAGIAVSKPDHVLPPQGIAALLQELALQP